MSEIGSPCPITPLIPLPPPADPPKKILEKEELIDKFATLFAPATPPATPRASPRLQPILILPHPSPHSHRSETISSPESDFGCFVSVAPSQDPLSLLSSGFSPSTSPVQSMTPHIRDESATNKVPYSASSAFFEKFTTDAKRASELNKKGYLDELLLHEDDPLYWLDLPSLSDSSGDSHDQDFINEDTSDKHVIDALAESERSQDLFLDGLAVRNTSPTPENEETPNDVAAGESSITKRIDVSSSSVPLPERTRSYPSPAMSLPPRPSSALAIFAPSSEPDLSLIPPPLSKSPSSSSLPHSSPRPDIKTLPTFSSRWMPSLLASSQPASPNAKEKLHTLFVSHPKKASKAPQSTHHWEVPDVPITTPTDGVAIPRGQHSRYTSAPSASISISHGTPFASHISSFAPPSGAPGFSGGDHSWDRGFSDDFDRDKADRGRVLLKGRIEGDGCVAILDTELARLIRPHLPALSRLPNSWTLLYSLDQHGSSLRTLYKRCENHLSRAGTNGTSAGELVVVKDSGDMVFGAWMGEGLRPSKGAYYGSGESFLWRFYNGELEAFKWTGKNEYVALCEAKFISFGGGDGHYGLYLDDTLIDGSSAHCLTFDNPPLCSPGPKKGETVTFESVALEVWSIG